MSTPRELTGVKRSVASAPRREAAIDPSALEQALHEAARLVRAFYENLDDRRVGAPAPMDDVIRTFTGTLGEEGIGLTEAMRDVERDVLPNAMAVPHPLYLGLLNSSPMAGGIVAESIISGLNNNAGSWEQGPAFVAAENEVRRCLAAHLGLDPEVSGIVLPGGSYAALHALQLARDMRLPEWRRGGARAVRGNPIVYVSEASHFSAVRAALAIGVAADDIVRVPTMGRGAMDVEWLATRVAADHANGHVPFAVVATLGTTGTGAIDPVSQVADVCAASNLWLHVDACYGGAAALVEGLHHHFEDLNRADSVAVDPHKWFYVPMVAGILFTRHGADEVGVFDVDAPYIPTGEHVDPFRRGLPTSRRAAGFAIWLALRAHGMNAVRAAVQRNIDLTRRLESRLRESGFRVMPGGELSIACARWEPEGSVDGDPAVDALQLRIAEAIVASGDAWFGTVIVDARRWLRFAMVSARTHAHHVDRLVERLAVTAYVAAGDRSSSTEGDGAGVPRS